MKKISKPEESAKKGVDHLVTATMTCPACDANWKFQYIERAENIASLYGVVRVELKGATYWRMNTEKFGVHTLCGACRAKRMAMHVIHKPGQNAEIREGWEQGSEARFKGNLKYQQSKYAAWINAIQIKPETQITELADEQADGMRQVLPKGRIAIHIDWKEQPK